VGNWGDSMDFGFCIVLVLFVICLLNYIHFTVFVNLNHTIHITAHRNDKLAYHNDKLAIHNDKSNLINISILLTLNQLKGAHLLTEYIYRISI